MPLAWVLDGGSGNQAARVLGAGTPLVTGRVAGAGGLAVRAGARGVAADIADGGGIAGVRRALRPTTGARLPAAVALALPARGVGGGDRTRRRDGSGVAGGGVARAGRDRRLCGGAQPTGVDRLVVVRAARLMTKDGG